MKVNMFEMNSLRLYNEINELNWAMILITEICPSDHPVSGSARSHSRNLEVEIKVIPEVT